MERLHWLLERAFDEDINQLSQTFTSVYTSFDRTTVLAEHTALRLLLVLLVEMLLLAPLQGWQASMPWDTNPLYAIMHESIYCRGGTSNWAAHRIREVSKCLHASVTTLILFQEPGHGVACCCPSLACIISLSCWV